MTPGARSAALTRTIPAVEAAASTTAARGGITKTRVPRGSRGRPRGARTTPIASKSSPSTPTGKYDVKTSIDDEWDDYWYVDPTITLTKHGDEVWDAYDFGMFSGIIKIAKAKSSSEGTAEFKWRGRENGEGEISSNNHVQTGTMTLGEGGKIEGVFKCLYGDEVTFEGQLNEVEGESYQSLKSKWEALSEEAYEDENRGRW